MCVPVVNRLFLCGLFLLMTWLSSANAQFTTIIDVPPSLDPGSAGTDTQVNVFLGGALGDGFDVGLPDGSSTNVELNIDGGSVGSNLDGYAGSTINLVEGTIDSSFNVRQGSQFNISGGSTGFIYTREGSQILATGGRINQLLGYGGTITVDGGSIGNLYPSFSAIGSGTVEPTVLNLIDGYVSGSLRANANSVVNISGGNIGQSFKARPSSVVNVSGGRINWYFDAEGEVNLTGGLIDSNFDALAGSEVNISGGRVGYNMKAHEGSQVTISGGNIGSFRALDSSTVRIAGGAYADGLALESGSDVVIVGGQFLLDGQSISGLNQVGETQVVSIPEGSFLSGTLGDGTPFAFTSADGDTLAGNISLEVASLPAIGQTLIVASTDPIPLGIRTGETLVVDDGGLTPQSFVAGPGSTLVVEAGGWVDHYAKAVGAVVNVSGGTIQNGFDAMLGSAVNVSGGEIRGSVDIYADSVMQMTGGESSGTLRAKPGGLIQVSAGSVRSLVAEGGTVEIEGGLFLFGPTALSGGQLQISGGVFQPGIRGLAGGELRLRGGEFLIDGEPVSGLATSGMTQQVDLPEGSVLTGVFKDGTTIALSSLLGDQITDGVLTLEATNLPPALPAMIFAPQDAVPSGLRNGQSLILGQGAILPDRFTAIEGSLIQLQAGGEIGRNLEIVGAELQVEGGVVRGIITALEGSRVEITGGNTNGRFTAVGAEVFVSGDAVVGYFTVGLGSEVTIVGGQVSVGRRRYPIDVKEGATLTFSGTAQTAGIAAQAGSQVIIAGGEIIEELDAFADSEVELIAAEFLLDGQPIVGLSPGESLEFLEREGVLSGQFVNGLEFEFELSATNNVWQDYFDPLATIILTQVLPYDLNFDGVIDTLDLEQWQNKFGTQPNMIGQGADGNFDGIVSGADFLGWQKSYGQSFDPSSSALSVPEPSAILLLLLGLALLRFPQKSLM